MFASRMTCRWNNPGERFWFKDLRGVGSARRSSRFGGSRARTRRRGWSRLGVLELHHNAQPSNEQKDTAADGGDPPGLRGTGARQHGFDGFATGISQKLPKLRAK